MKRIAAIIAGVVTAVAALAGTGKDNHVLTNLWKEYKAASLADLPLKQIEILASVDTRTEKKIQDAMAQLMKNRTSVIIAHRLSTIMDADKIVVMDQGRVVETGTHEELLNLGGRYAELYQTQFAGLET